VFDDTNDDGACDDVNDDGENGAQSIWIMVMKAYYFSDGRISSNSNSDNYGNLKYSDTSIT
jgi:hypothetical protein